MRASKLALGLVVAGFCTAISAQSSESNTSNNGIPARIAALEARVAKLEGKITAASDLVGTYRIQQFQTELGGWGGQRVAVYTGGGQIKLEESGKGTISGNRERGHELQLWNGGSLAAVDRPQPTESFDWSFHHGQGNHGWATLWGMNFSVADGGRLLISTSSNPEDGTNVLLLLVRVD